MQTRIQKQDRPGNCKAMADRLDDNPTGQNDQRIVALRHGTEGMTLATHWRDYIQLLRPAQWVKNVVVLAAPAAGLKLITWEGFGHAAAAFVALCLAAAGGYAINDAIDRRADALHPTKRFRPVARGSIGATTAIGIGLFFLSAALTLSTLACGAAVAAVVGTYFALTMAYSLVLKRWILVDVIAISIGFVLRAWAGALAVGVAASAWLVACVFTLCLFLGFGKRRCELAMMGGPNDAGRHRRTLVHYTPDLLNHLITVSAGIAVMTFLLYTMDPARTLSPFPKEQLFFTLPIVVYGIFRFAMVTELGLYSGPTEIVLKDKPMLIAILFWAAAALAIAYQTRIVGPEGWSGWLHTLRRTYLTT